MAKKPRPDQESHSPDMTVGPGDSLLHRADEPTPASQMTSLSDIAPLLPEPPVAPPRLATPTTAGPTKPTATSPTAGYAAPSSGQFVLPDPNTPVWTDDRVPNKFPVLLGEYELLSILGQGGMGVVFKARYLRLHRIVALKMIRSDVLASPEVVERFRREARSAAELDHPNIVQVYDFAEVNDKHFYTMAYVEGESLKARIKNEKKIPLPQALRLILPVCDAVHDANSKGIIHRDLKPENILIGPGGSPRITDFGLAKRLDDATQQTENGRVLGTAEYMPPEQARGLIHMIGPHSDTYSLGAILYHMVSGESAFPGTSVTEVLCKVILEPPPPLAEKVPGMPDELEAIILRALSKEVGDRFANAGEFASALRDCIRHNKRLMAGSANPSVTDISLEASEIEEAVEAHRKKAKYRPLSQSRVDLNNEDDEPKRRSLLPVIVLGLLLGLGIAVAGYFVLNNENKNTIASATSTSTPDIKAKDDTKSTPKETSKGSEETHSKDSKKSTPIVPVDLPPERPMNVLASNPTATALTLTWDDTTQNATALKVEWALEPTFAAVLGTKELAPGSRSTVINGLNPGTSYHFRVSVSNNAGSATSQPLAVATLKANTPWPPRKPYQAFGLDVKAFDDINTEIKFSGTLSLPEGSKIRLVTAPSKLASLYLFKRTGQGGDATVTLIFPSSSGAAYDSLQNRADSGENMVLADAFVIPDEADGPVQYWVVGLPKTGRRDKLDITGLARNDSKQLKFSSPDDFLKRALVDGVSEGQVSEQFFEVRGKAR